MDNYGGREPTGRRVRGPVSELVELGPKTEDDVIHTAIVYDEPFHGHSALSDNVRLALNFMEYPMVAGLAELDDHDIDKAWYVYATGATRSVAEVLKSYRDIGQTVGERAAMELCYLAAMAIGEAGESGPTQGVYSHGDLSPWRILVQEDGQVMLIGHGIPQVEVLEWRADPDSHKLREESFHYTPPERIEGAPEDPVADIYSLALIAFECITGKTLFQGNADKVLKQARHAEGPQLVQKEKSIPGPIRDLLEQCLQFDPNNRPSPDEFIAVLYDLLSAGLSGDALGDVVQRVFGAKSRGRALRSADGETSVVPRRTVQGAGARPVGNLVRGGVRAPVRKSKGVEEDDGGRWGKVARGREAEEEEESTDNEEATGRRRRRRTTEDDDTTSRRGRRRRRTEDEAEEDADSALRRRRRRRSSSDDDSDDSDESDDSATSTDDADDSSDSDDSGSSRRRRRRSSTDDDKADAKDDSADDDSGSSRRRRRRSTSDDDESSDDKADAKDDSADDDSGSSRRRRRRSSSDDESSDDKADAKDDSADDDSGSSRRRRRRSSSDDESSDDKADAKDDSADDDSGSSRRRRRRSSSDDDAADDDKADAKDDSADDDSGSSRRRRRRSSSDDDESSDDKADAKDDSADDDSPARRRRRRSTDDDASEPKEEPKAEEKDDDSSKSGGRTRRKSRRRGK